MFRDEVSEGPSSCQGTVSFEPFEGVAPRLFRRVFVMPPRPRDRVTGRYATWDGTKSQQRLLADTVAPPLAPMETRVIRQFFAQLKGTDWEPPTSSNSQSGTS